MKTFILILALALNAKAQSFTNTNGITSATNVVAVDGQTKSNVTATAVVQDFRLLWSSTNTAALSADIRHPDGYVTHSMSFNLLPGQRTMMFRVSPGCLATLTNLQGHPVILSVEQSNHVVIWTNDLKDWRGR